MIGRMTNLRPATAADRPFLAAATLGNLNWCGPRFTMDDVRANPAFWHYVEPWPGPEDFGFVAEDDAGAALGIVWLKHFPASDPGYGFVDAAIPELSIHVVPAHRGQGVGRRLMEAAIAEARRRGVQAISLSVEDANTARRLYARVGFEPVGPMCPGTYRLTLRA